MLHHIRQIFSYFLAPIDIYTDGSFKQGRGSWAYVMMRSGKIVKEASGCCVKTNSLLMEIQGAVEAIKAAPKEKRLRIFSDCRILIDAMTCLQHPRKERFETLYELSKQRQITWTWVRGHSGNPMNERCDQLCVTARSRFDS